MRTCLSGLWDFLDEHILEMKRISLLDEVSEVEYKMFKGHMKSSCEKLNEILLDKRFKIPEHVEIFFNILKKEKELKTAAEQALSYVKDCNLCAGCIGCATRFYQMILDSESRERTLPMELTDYFSGNSQLYYYLSAYRTVKSYRKINNTLICLKGFSSTTPAIYSATFENTCTGGGLYINIDGYGMVIDPGIGFVDSMHKQGIFIEDINTVIVTHNHLDHNADLGTISALQHDMNGYYERQINFYKKFFPEIKNKEHKIKWIFDEETQEASRSIIPNSTQISEYLEWITLNDSISIKVIRTEHLKDGNSYGIKFKIKIGKQEIIVGYTSDTKYFSDLSTFYADTDILVFNISDIYEKDVRGTKKKRGHLGYDGSINLLMNVDNLRLAIASEFCCNNGDYRSKVVRQMSEQLQKYKKIQIIPGEVGLKVDLENQGICCDSCKSVVPFNKISVIAPECDFGKIHYICSKCQYDLKSS